VIGTKDSWGTATAASRKHPSYLSSTWSPCGQLIAVVATEAVEIWDALTLKPFSTLHSTNVATKFRNGLAYSPDGYSLAGCSNTGIVIWDVQTGGEVTKIECEVPMNGLDLVWSLDGKKLALFHYSEETITVTTYDVTSGTKISTGTLQSMQTIHLGPWQILSTCNNNTG
jgi:WD40 repeat protein